VGGDLNALREELYARVRERGGATDALVANALRDVPRHLFLPDEPPRAAYEDAPVVTKRDDDGQPISSSSQPTIMAVMLDQLGLRPGHRVLEIGAGTGFNAALMAYICGAGDRVVSVDIDADSAERARENLAAAGYDDVTVLVGDGALGHPARAPYDRIIATVGVWDLAPPWVEQLAPGGRIVVPLDVNGLQRSVCFESVAGRLVSRSAMPCGFMRMRGSLRGPDQVLVLDKETLLTVTLPTARDVDREALRDALAVTPTSAPTGVAATEAELFDGLGLWLAVHEPRWLVVSEKDGARLRDAPLRGAPGTVMAAGILDEDGMALVSGTAELTALGYGPAGDRLAAELAGHVHAWDAAGRPGTAALRIEAHPTDSTATGEVVIEKVHTRLVLTWTTP
jgi:protein-L-isoaspartate(D-aspartate) O-methyltransferase